MVFPANITSTMWIPSAIGLFSMFVVSAIVMWRRRQWEFETQAMERAGSALTQDHIQKTQYAQRMVDLLSGLLHCIYYVSIIASAVISVVSLFTTIEQSARLHIWLAITGTSWGGALILALSWQGRDDEQEHKMRKKLRRAQEHELSRRGLTIRDVLTRTYTPEFWLHALELRINRTFRRPTLITCLMIEVKGLAELRSAQGNDVGDRVLIRLGQEITRNIRSSDIVSRYGDHGFAIALFRCPTELGRMVAERVTANATHVVLKRVNRHYGSSLHLLWEIATLPGDAVTPVQLLFATKHSLVQKSRQLAMNEKRGEICKPVPC